MGVEWTTLVGGEPWVNCIWQTFVRINTLYSSVDILTRGVVHEIGKVWQKGSIVYDLWYLCVRFFFFLVQSFISFLLFGSVIFKRSIFPASEQ